MNKLYLHFPTTGNAELPLETARVVKTLNKEDYVLATLKSQSKLNIPLGSYIYAKTASDASTTKYTVNKTAKEVKLASNLFQYSVLLESPMYDLKKAVFQILGETDTAYIGTASDYLTLLISSLSADGYNFTAGTVDSTIEKSLKFTGEKCWPVLNRICDVFDLEFKFESNVISLQYRIQNDRTGIALSQGYTNGIISITQKDTRDVNIVTKLYYQGGSKNLPFGYGSKRLKGSTDFVTNNLNYGVYADTFYFDEIFPTYTGTVGTVEYKDGGKTPTFISSLPFDLNNVLIAGISPTVSMINGSCAGYEFEVFQYDVSTGKFWIKPQTDAAGNQIPDSTGLNIASGDQFKILNIDLPQSYIDQAVSDLDDAAAAKIADISEIPVEFDIVPDKKRIELIYNGGENVFDIGDQLNITDTDLGIPSDQRITQISYDLYYKPDVKFTISAARFSLFGRSEEIDNYLNTRANYENQLLNPTKIQKTYRTTDDIYKQTFSHIDNKLDVDYNARKESFDPYALALDSGELQFSFKTVQLMPNYGDDPNVLHVKSGTVIHHSINAMRRFEIEKLTSSYEPYREWSIAAVDINLPSDTTEYYIFAKIPILDGETVAEVIISDVHLYAKSIDDHILYKIGKVTAKNCYGVRNLNALLGLSTPEIVKFRGGTAGVDVCLENPADAGDVNYHPLTLDSNITLYGSTKIYGDQTINWIN